MSILIFGGTIEGRQASEYLVERHIRHTVCVATEYGEEVLRTGITDASGANHPSCQASAEKFGDANEAKDEFTASGKEGKKWRTVHQGRMDAEQMRAFFRDNTFALVVDATHPYAVEVSKNIREACEKEQVPYVRYLRSEGGETDTGSHAAEAVDMIERNDAAKSGSRISSDGKSNCSNAYNKMDSGVKKNITIVYVNSALEAAEYLEVQEGGIFLTTGSKELHIFTGHISDKSRLFARVLPSAEVIASCRSLGLEGKQICAMQGPFSAEINAAMLRQTEASFLVTKETGASGGYPEKLEAVQTCGITAVVIRRPEESGAGWAEVRATIDEVLAAESGGAEAYQELENGGCASGRRISCIGIGMGTPETMTREAAREIREAEVIFGAKRMLECAKALFHNEIFPQMVAEYSASKIDAWLKAHPQIRRAAILMSGDVGFYSGARQIAETFPAGEVHYYCGISSVVYFASRIPASWQDAKLLSAHGKDLALVNYVKKYPKIILLVGGEKDVSRFCRQLVTGGMNYVKVTIGTNLSYPDERIDAGSPGDFLDYASDAGLYVMMIENARGGPVITPGIPDQEFLRGDVPMTKEEIRALSIAKLRLKEDSTIFDVGAGTGSISIECASLCTEGQVYAIERNPDGAELIQQNIYKFGVANLSIVEGTAPEAMQGLPAPTHAFIGGSSGNMREIIEALQKMNPSVRIVINTVTLESIAEVMNLIREMHLSDADIVQISAAKSRALGSYHLMTAHNPVYIVSFGGGNESADELM